MRRPRGINRLADNGLCGCDSREKKVADEAYGRRSSILHQGKLAIAEAAPKTIEGAIDWINDDQSRRKVIRFSRACIINWLVSKNDEQGAQ